MYNKKLKKYIKTMLLFILIINVNNYVKTYAVTTIEENWWDYNWKYRKKLVINPFFVSGAHSNFPLLINLTDDDLSEKALKNGNDIFFIDIEGNKLYHEIELYDNATGHLIAWVNIPVLVPYPETILFLYYGNPSALGQETPKKVWISNYQIVMHFNEKDNVIVLDSSSQNNGYLIGGIKQNDPGIIGNAYDFFARISRYEFSGGYVEIENNEELESIQNFTVSFWLKLEDLSRRQTILNKYDTYQYQRGWFVGYNNHSSYGPVLELYISKDGVSFSNWYAKLQRNTILDNWNYYSISWELGGKPRLYLNGFELITLGQDIVQGINRNEVPIWIGDSVYANGRELDGILDEVRICNATKSAQWILTEYVSQHQNDNVIDKKSEERLRGAPIIKNPLPHDSEYIVSTDLSEISFDLEDYQSDLMNYTVSTFPDIGSGYGVNVLNGRHSTPVKGLQHSQTYTWRINATDGLESTVEIYSFTPMPPGIDIIPPISRIALEEVYDEDEIFHFDGSNSTDNIGITDFTWRFYDSGMQILKGIHPSYVFTTPGEYIIELTVTDSSGNQNTDVKNITILDITPPEANLGKDRNAYLEAQISFDGSKSTDNVEIVYYEWNLGDGAVYFDPVVTHTFLDVGDYNVTLTVKDEAGNEDSNFIKVTVLPTGDNTFFLTMIFALFILVLLIVFSRFLTSPTKKLRLVRD